MPFLVGTGSLPDSEMNSGSIALQAFWGGELLKCSSSDCPNELLSSLPKDDSLVQLMGDAGSFHPDNGCWLEIKKTKGGVSSCDSTLASANVSKSTT